MQMEQLRPHKAISSQIKAPGTELSPDEFTQMGSGDSDDPAGGACRVHVAFSSGRIYIKTNEEGKNKPRLWI